MADPDSITQDQRLTAHNQGVLAFLTGTQESEPPAGDFGTAAAAFRAGWFSAKTAMEADGDAAAVV